MYQEPLHSLRNSAKHASFKRQSEANVVLQYPNISVRRSKLKSLHVDFAKLVVLLAVQNPEDGEEKVEDVEVEGDGCGNLLLNLVVADDQLQSGLAT